jgi:hypothetical protein
MDNNDPGRQHDYDYLPLAGRARFMDLLTAVTLAGQHTKGLDSSLHTR